MGRSVAAAAVSARERAQTLLQAHGASPTPPSRPDLGHKVRLPLAGAAPAVTRNDGADPGHDDLMARAMSGAPGADAALRLLELQTLQQIASSVGRRRAPGAPADLDDLFVATDVPEADEGLSMRTAKGSESLNRILRNIEKHPELWNAHFDQSIRRTLRADVTGSPWSLLEYTIRRVHFAKQDEDMEKVLHLLCHLHALHRMGPDHFQSLGAAIGQCYKACEQRQRDGDWTLGWVWTGVPDPRPSALYARTLAHPSEHAAGLAYLRELHTLAAHREMVAAGAAPAAYPRAAKTLGGKGAPGPAASPSGAEASGWTPRPYRQRGRGRGERGGAKAAGKAQPGGGPSPAPLM